MATAYAGYSRLSDDAHPGIGAAIGMAEGSAQGDVAGDGDEGSREDICYYRNAATCPDCGTSMVRLGMCFSCQGCGFQSCGG